jgi:hypothetical protein
MTRYGGKGCYLLLFLGVNYLQNWRGGVVVRLSFVNPDFIFLAGWVAGAS